MNQLVIPTVLSHNEYLITAISQQGQKLLNFSASTTKLHKLLLAIINSKLNSFQTYIVLLSTFRINLRTISFVDFVQLLTKVISIYTCKYILSNQFIEC